MAAGARVAAGHRGNLARTETGAAGAADIFAEALSQDAGKPLPPLELVALAEENADLLPTGQAGQDLAARLADRLVALDLPRRAVPVLEKLAASAPAGPVRAAFGDRLASMRLAQGDPIGALAALSASDAPSLPEPLLQARTLTCPCSSRRGRDAARHGGPRRARHRCCRRIARRIAGIREGLAGGGGGAAGLCGQDRAR
jgi:hypothetical protein